MGRYFFRLCGQIDYVLDPKGMELADSEAAEAEALRAARATLSREIKEGLIDLSYRIDVEDENGAVIYRLPLRDAFRIIG